MNNIKSLREYRGYTQDELAETAGISTVYLASLENGKRKNPSLTVLKQLADALSVKLDELMREGVTKDER